MPIANYTTEITAEKSIAEIQKMLQNHKARAVVIEFDDDSFPASLSFIVMTQYGELAFRLPANTERLYVLLLKQRVRGVWEEEVKRRIREQAKRIGWRILKDWVRAQMAIIETEMVTLEQVMLPYLQVNNKSLYEAIQEKKFYLAEGKKE